MESKFPLAPLEQIAELSGGFAFKSSDYRSGGRFVLRSLNILDDGTIDHSNAVYLPEERDQEFSRFLLHPHDTLFVMVGANLGKIGYVRESDLPALLNQNMWLIRARVGTDPRFLHYAFRIAAKSGLGWASGSARDFVRRSDYRSLLIPLPPLAEQVAIADVLSSLDDKIQINKRMSATLEVMARALFKSWFVDFEPVRAKAEGRDPRLATEITALFPDSFQDSGMGDVPWGWSTPRLSAILEESNERIGTRSAPEYSSTNEGLQERSARFKKALALSTVKNKLIRKGYLVFGLSRQVLNFGLMRDELGSVSAAYKVFRIKDSTVAPDMLERLMRSNPNYFYGAVSASSREGQAVSAEGLGALRIVHPPQAVQEAFYRIVDVLTSRTRACELESRTLASLRDTLLPKLVFGEIRVTDAERIVAKLV